MKIEIQLQHIFIALVIVASSITIGVLAFKGEPAPEIVVETPENYTHLADCYDYMVAWYDSEDDSPAETKAFDDMDKERCFYFEVERGNRSKSK